MAKQVVGLKIGASALAAARVSTNGAVQVEQLAREPLAPGVVAAGEVRDVGALATALKAFFKKHKLPKRAVRVGIANNRIGVRTIELSGIDDPRQLANAIRFRAQEVLPVPIEEAVLDYHVLSDESGDDGVSRKRVLLVVAYRDLVDAYVAACKEAGLRLAGIDLEAFALLRALSVPHPAGGERSALVAVAVGAERSTLAVSDGETCEFTRVVEWGGTALTGALARVLDVDVEEAERIKTELTLHGDGPAAGLSAESAARARDALHIGLQTFARELVSSLQFYQGQPDSLGIREVVLAGGTAQLGGLAEVLERLIGVPVRVGDPLTAVSVAKKFKGGGVAPSLAVPIGLGMAR
ncbi:MAG TPA: type IV pilus assembly protein PilM [Gaiellaceae bacterium]|nr:type IV pilus assembly protein PilM [Gaiellaceae bacterium]